MKEFEAVPYWFKAVGSFETKTEATVVKNLFIYSHTDKVS